MPPGLRLLAVAAAFVVLAAALSAFAVWRDLVAYMGRPGPAESTVTVVIPPGESMARIIARLDDAGVIERPWMFRLGARLLDKDRSLKAGEYAFPARITPRGVLAMLHEGATVVRRVTVFEGATVAEVFAMLEGAPGLTGEMPEPPPEGSLLPETYFYALGETRESLVERMRRAMKRAVEEAWARRRPDLPIATPEELVTLASIVEKETALPGERPRVAAVFLNRLRRGMKLQADPTVIYDLTGGNGSLGRELRRSDLLQDGAYNTYRIDGLPPGPIANPGRDALAAVADPADVEDLYFVADGTGGHAFARTLREHNRNVDHWRRLQRRGEGPPVIPPSPPKPVVAEPKPAAPEAQASIEGDPAPEPAAGGAAAAAAPAPSPPKPEVPDRDSAAVPEEEEAPPAVQEPPAPDTPAPEPTATAAGDAPEPSPPKPPAPN